MPVEFFTSKNNLPTCKFGSINLHSAYDPLREAKRFVDSITADFTPRAIIVTAPCISYCAQYLKTRFPGIPIYAVQFSNEFTEWDKCWTKSFVYDENLSEELYNSIGDEGLISTLFLSWQPSVNAYPELYAKTWNKLKNAVLKSRNILNTRSYFSKRWIRNSIKFASMLKNEGKVKKGTKDIIVCASGPSLYSSLKKIKAHRNLFSLICVSSALSVLVENGIIPDLCVSTDGGYWAKKHLSFSLKKHPEITLALPLEAALYSSLFETHDVVPLSYGDGPAEDIIKECSIECFKTKRNGTVSGTAADIALSLTSGKVYFCGLDLSTSKGFVHTQPNELEITDSVQDYRFKTKETRIVPNTFTNPSLEIYKSWFASTNFNGRLYRLSNDYSYSNTLGKIKDVNWDYFLNNNSDSSTKNDFIISHTANIISKSKQIIECINKNKYSEEWIKNAFPVEYVLYERSKGCPGEANALEDMNKKMSLFADKLIKDIKK